MQDITDVDYMRRKRVCKYFKIKILGEYLYLYVESNPLLLADVLENFWSMCLEVYELDSVCFFTEPG